MKSEAHFFRIFGANLRTVTGFILFLIILLFFGALFWAREQDPFSRKWFTVKVSGGGEVSASPVKCVAIWPKPLRKYPVIIYVHGFGGSLINDGNDLRHMAELGMATISVEYNQTNEAAFESQFGSLLDYLNRQTWVDTNAIAWVGFSLGSIRIVDFARQHPRQQPQLLVQLSGTDRSDAGLSPTQLTGSRKDAQRVSEGSNLSNLHCPVLLIHGDDDKIFPVADTERLASVLQSNGVPVELKVLHGLSHGMGEDRGVIFRCIGEFCLKHLGGKDSWQNYHSIAQWQAEAPALWLFWLPAAAWALGWLVWSRICRAGSRERIKLERHEIALRWAVVLLAAGAIGETALRVVPPRLSVSKTTLSMARRFLIHPKESADFEYLAAQPIWRGYKLKALLEHVELASYNRGLVDWSVEDKNYRDFVLSPVITGQSGEKMNWRRRLWEEFYPRIRHELAPEDAARIVVRHLRERVSIVDLPNLPREVPDIWLRQITDETGFEVIYVATLRSIGVSARLDSRGKAEFWDGVKWSSPPPPCGTM